MRSAYPLLEAVKERSRAILGMFDVSARLRVPEGVLTFAVPWSKFERMLANADQTFLTTGTLGKPKDSARRKLGLRQGDRLFGLRAALIHQDEFHVHGVGVPQRNGGL